MLCLSPGRFCAYITITALAGGEAQAQWRDVLDGNAVGIAGTTAALILLLIAFALMVRRDCRKRREEN